MNRSMRLLMALAATVALLPACGGGDDDAAASEPTAPTPPGAGAATEANARILATEAHAALAAAELRDSLPTLPGGVAFSLPCPGGGNFSYDFPTTVGAGTTYTISYNNCSDGEGGLITGSYQITYAGFTSQTDFSFTATYNLSYSGNGRSETVTGTQTCTASAGSYSCTYNDGKRSWGSGFSYSSGRLAGSYSWSDASLGTLTYTFEGFTSTSGTVRVTGSGGFTATITRTGANTYSVVINGSAPFVVTVT